MMHAQYKSLTFSLSFYPGSEQENLKVLHISGQPWSSYPRYSYWMMVQFPVSPIRRARITFTGLCRSPSSRLLPR